MNSPRPLSLRTLLTTAALSLVTSTALAFSSPATIRIDGQRVATDVPPVVTPGRQTYLPLRAVTSRLGARVAYDKKTHAIVVTRGTDRIKLRLGRKIAVYNGKTLHLTHAPFAVRGRTMVAARTIERTLGPIVKYDARASTIEVVTSDTSPDLGMQETSTAAF